MWRGEHYAATSSDYSAIKAQLEAERFPAAWEGGPTRFWADLGQEEQDLAKKSRLKMYSQKVYKVGLLVLVHHEQTVSDVNTKALVSIGVLVHSSMTRLAVLCEALVCSVVTG